MAFREHPQTAILETCDLRLDTWDTDYISDNWEQQYSPLHYDPCIKNNGDSIRNSCNVFLLFQSMHRLHLWKCWWSPWTGKADQGGAEEEIFWPENWGQQMGGLNTEESGLLIWDPTFEMELWHHNIRFSFWSVCPSSFCIFVFLSVKIMSFNIIPVAS